jgi:lysophospholipase L1-like esterase/acetyl esterase/lipase
VLIGDSITHTLCELGGKYEPLRTVWERHFAPRHAINLGYSGYRTEQILWNLQHGELDFAVSPKVAIVLIGTNNSDDRHFAKVHTAEEIFAGTKAIVNLIRQRHPTTKILVLRIFPRGGDAEKGVSPPPFNSSVQCIETCRRAGELTAKLADGRQVFWLDVNYVFLDPDGTINTDLMWDLLHPSPAGAEAWAQAIEPTLAQLMGDQPLAVEVPSNTALVPVPKLEEDSYDWYARHAEVLRIKDRLNPEVVLIGDSITHFWGGEPKAAQANGPTSWQATFGPYRTLNLGFGWDRIQNVLWRLDHGELDGLHPRVIVLHIGTNNTSDTEHARKNTPAEIAEGVRAIVRRLRARTPDARIILMAVFPREQKPDHPRRQLITQINASLSELGQLPGVAWLDIGPKLLQPDGTISPEIMRDFCHPTEKGYRIWGDALAPLLATSTTARPKNSGETAQNERILLWPDVASVGDGRYEKADARITIYRPAHPNGTAAVICPGGGYGGLVTGPEGSGIARWLNDHGIAGIVLEYRLPHGRPFVPLLDAQRAIRLVRFRSKELGCNPHRIGIIGFSAGGHLAATAATHFDAGKTKASDLIERMGCRPDFAVLVYPVITMGSETHSGTKQNLLGTSPSADLVDLFSNEKQVTARTPPTFLAHALDDRIVTPQNSRLFYEALQAHKVASRYLELPHGDHGLNGYQGPMWDAWQAGALKWLAFQRLISTKDAESPPPGSVSRH